MQKNQDQKAFYGISFISILRFEGKIISSLIKGIVVIFSIALEIKNERRNPIVAPVRDSLADFNRKGEKHSSTGYGNGTANPQRSRTMKDRVQYTRL